MKRGLLIVDDEGMNRTLISCLAKQIACEDGIIYEAENGEEAIKIMKDHKDHIQLIFMDFNMPIMDGGLATKYIKEELNIDIPIVLVTAYDIEAIKHQGCDVNIFDDIIFKPVNKDKVHSSILKYICLGSSVG